jgi:glycosyltransferase involved in cell wall biosynthesis
MKEIEFSIIICPFNSRDLLKKTLESLRWQNFGDFELIIVDRNSSDNTKIIIEKYKDIFGDKLRWMSLEDESLMEAMNEGVKMARGKYLSILEVGEEVEQNSLQLALKSAQKYPQADVVYGVRNIWDLSKRKKGSLNGNAELLPATGNIKFANLYYKKELHNQFGFYESNNKIIEDYAFCLKAFYLGGAIVRPFDLVTESNQISISNF